MKHALYSGAGASALSGEFSPRYHRFRIRLEQFRLLFFLLLRLLYYIY